MKVWDTCVPIAGNRRTEWCVHQSRVDSRRLRAAGSAATPRSRRNAPTRPRPRPGIPVDGSESGNSEKKSSSDGTVVGGKITCRSPPGTVVVVTAGATVVDVEVVGATLVDVVDPATVVVVPRTVVVVGGRVVLVGGKVVVVGGRVVVVSTTVVVVGGSVVVVSTTVVVVVSTTVVVVESGIVVVVVGGRVVVVTGGSTAELLMDLSSLPALQLATLEQAKSSTLMWYGDPAIEDAELSAPQSACEAT